MHAVSNTYKPSGTERSGRQLVYHLFAGSLSGAAVVAFAVLPQPEITGLGFTAAALLGQLISIITRRFSAAPLATRLRRKRATIVYLVVAGVALIGAFVMDWTVVRGSDALWLAWTMAGLVFVVFASGAWIIGGRSTHETASDTA
jgi:hypothetical protein